jgi:hypothetical protein
MAALLDRIQLRRHALPAFIAAELDREIDRRESRPAAPRLVASWRLGANGRPECAWSLGQRADDGSTLDRFPG